MGFKFTDWLISTDMYGLPVTVNYHGSDKYQTKLGAFFSVATYTLIVMNVVGLIQGFYDNSKQSESQQTKNFDPYFEKGYSL